MTGDNTMIFHLGENKCAGLIEASERFKGKDRRFIDGDMQEAIFMDINERLYDEKHML